MWNSNLKIQAGISWSIDNILYLKSSLTSLDPILLRLETNLLSRCLRFRYPSPARQVPIITDSCNHCHPTGLVIWEFRLAMEGGGGLFAYLAHSAVTQHSSELRQFLSWINLICTVHSTPRSQCSVGSVLHSYIQHISASVPNQIKVMYYVKCTWMILLIEVIIDYTTKHVTWSKLLPL